MGGRCQRCGPPAHLRVSRRPVRPARVRPGRPDRGALIACGFMANGGPQPAWRGSRSHSAQLPAWQRADPAAVAGQCVQALRSTPGHEVLFNTFTVREVRLRGLLATGRTGQAVDLTERFAAGDGPPTPQWRVIERITTADALARSGDEHAAAKMLSAAICNSETLQLPHQVQRIIRPTGQSGVLTGQRPARQQAQAGAHAPGQTTCAHDSSDELIVQDLTRYCGTAPRAGPHAGRCGLRHTPGRREAPPGRRAAARWPEL